MGTQLRNLILANNPQAADIASFLNGVGLEEKISATRSLSGPRVQRRLWDTVATNPRVVLSDLVPSGHQPLKPVVFHGKNSLPAFTTFEKICCRPPSAQAADELWGYNETVVRGLVGPGYYVVRSTAEAKLGGAAFDYTLLPGGTADGWPELRENHKGVSRLVYAGMVDYMRRVADDVFIGSATKGNRELGSYFLLVREID